MHLQNVCDHIYPPPIPPLYRSQIPHHFLVLPTLHPLLFYITSQPASGCAVWSMADLPGASPLKKMGPLPLLRSHQLFIAP